MFDFPHVTPSFRGVSQVSPSSCTRGLPPKQPVDHGRSQRGSWAKGFVGGQLGMRQTAAEPRTKKCSTWEPWEAWIAFFFIEALRMFEIEIISNLELKDTDSSTYCNCFSISCSHPFPYQKVLICFQLPRTDSNALAALQDAILASKALEAQDVATISWAFATMGASSQLLSKLAEQSVSKCRDFTPRHLAITCWALAKVKVSHEDFVLATAGQMQACKVRNGREHGTAREMVWGFFLSSEHHMFFDCFWAINHTRTSTIYNRKHQKTRFETSFWTVELCRQADGWMPQDLSNFLWASAVLRCDLPLPLELIAARAAELQWQRFKPQVDLLCFHWFTISILYFIVLID